MTNEVKFNEDDYVWGEWSDLSSVKDKEDIVQVSYIGDSTFYRAGNKKQPDKIEVGKAYTTKNGYEWLCITQLLGFSYLVGIYDKQVVEGATAYSWYASGKSHNLGPSYNIDWSVEPMEMGVIE